MGLKNNFDSLRDSLFNTFSNFIEQSAAIKYSIPNKTFDPATGENIVSYSVSITSAKAFLGKYTQNQFAGEILAGDLPIIMKVDEVPNEPEPNGKIVVGSDEYIIVNTNPVPKTNPVIWRLQCRGVGSA